MKKPKKYSIFSLVRNALSFHENWQPAWRNPEIKKNYDNSLNLITDFILNQVSSKSNN